MDRFEAMTLFTTVAEAGGFSAASRRLGIPVSTLSRKVTALEAKLGTRLLTRSSQGLQLTEKGRAWHLHCRRILAEMEAAEAALGDDTAVVSGTLRVTAPVIFGLRFAAPLVAAFTAAHPRAAVELSLNDRAVDLAEEGFDLAIRTGVLADSSLVARRLGSFRRILCCAPAYLERHGPLGALGDLERAEALVFTRLANPQRWRLRDSGGGEHVVAVHGRLISDSADALYVAALAGQGVVLTPAWQARADIEAGRLVRLLPDFATAPVPVHALFPDARLLSGKVRALLDAAVRAAPALLEP
ncbi:MAG TPA: LysR family transcriptional regulator [Roseomonas sp.]|nr:LysR family transcriptional regulator [Roseomonas sp.]